MGGATDTIFVENADKTAFKAVYVADPANGIINQSSDPKQVESQARLQTEVSYTVTIPLLIDFGDQSKTIDHSYTAKDFQLVTSHVTLNPGNIINIAVKPTEGTTFELTHATVTTAKVPWRIFARNAESNLSQTTAGGLTQAAYTAAALKSVSATAPATGIEGLNNLLYVKADTDSADLSLKQHNNAYTGTANNLGSATTITSSTAAGSDYDKITGDGLAKDFVAIIDKKDIGPAGTYTQLLTFILTYVEPTT